MNEFFEVHTHPRTGSSTQFHPKNGVSFIQNRFHPKTVLPNIFCKSDRPPRGLPPDRPPLDRPKKSLLFPFPAPCSLFYSRGHVESGEQRDNLGPSLHPGIRCFRLSFAEEMGRETRRLKKRSGKEWKAGGVTPSEERHRFAWEC